MHFLLADNQQLRTIIFSFEKKARLFVKFCHNGNHRQSRKTLTQKPKKIMHGITILIHEFNSFVSVKILDGGLFPRVRTTGRLDGLYKILKNELAHFKEMGIEVSFARKNAGKFGGIKWKDIAKLR